MNIKKRVTVTIDGKSITATPDMLNQISLWIIEAKDAYEAKCPNSPLAKMASKAFMEVHDQLATLGYYDRYR